MNFKLTKLKVILSIIIGLIIGNLIGWKQIIIPTDLVWRFVWGPFILFFIVSTILIYIIWSLIQKKK